MWHKSGSVRTILLAALLIFLAGVAAAFAFITITGVEAEPQKTHQDQPSEGTQVALSGLFPGIGPETIADIVERAAPAVVRIDTVTETQSFSSPFNDPFFRQFFGDQYNPGPQERRGLGSGFIITDDGYILTNQHVIQDAKQVKVTVTGYEQPLDAQVVGTDKALDLAVLKINTGKPLPYLTLGDVNKVRVGEWAIAIGNPDGLDHTVTVGVISAKGRPIDVQDRHYENLLQTDASINPGNSGGPLLNLNGEVIGINTAVNISAQGIGFAIPSSTVEPVLNDLMTKGRIARPWIGVELRAVTPDVAEILGYRGNEGALVTGIISRSPAAGNIEKYDIIMEIDGRVVTDPNDLIMKVQEMKIGQNIRIKVFRRGEIREVNITLGERPTE